jgi:hypothetical protein
MKFATPADLDANIENTLLFASIEGMEQSDLRVLAVLVTWFGVHAPWVNADPCPEDARVCQLLAQSTRQSGPDAPCLRAAAEASGCPAATASPAGRGAGRNQREVTAHVPGGGEGPVGPPCQLGR